MAVLVKLAIMTSCALSLLTYTRPTQNADVTVNAKISIILKTKKNNGQPSLLSITLKVITTISSTIQVMSIATILHRMILILLKLIMPEALRILTCSRRS